MKMIEMEIDTVYFLPYRVPSSVQKEAFFDCMMYKDGKLLLMDSESYYIFTEDGLKSLREIMYPYEED